MEELIKFMKAQRNELSKLHYSDKKDVRELSNFIESMILKLKGIGDRIYLHGLIENLERDIDRIRYETDGRYGDKTLKQFLIEAKGDCLTDIDHLIFMLTRQPKGIAEA
jgi:hypothetical protein